VTAPPISIIFARESGEGKTMVIVKISPTVTDTQRADPRFISLLQQAKDFFNCREDCSFNKAYRRSLCLHEAGHINYARSAGATCVEFHGPEMFWDYRPELGYDCPAISRSCVTFVLPRGTTPTEAIKASIAGFVIRGRLDTPNDEVAISSDMESARYQYARFGGVADDFGKTYEKARNEILQDLQDGGFLYKISATAKEFEKAVFPAPKLTAAALRAKRLGWMYA
jgi:hypothetical protein